MMKYIKKIYSNKSPNPYINSNDLFEQDYGVHILDLPMTGHKKITYNNSTKKSVDGKKYLNSIHQRIVCKN